MMDQYPTEEEEFEFRCQDELEMLQEEDDFYGPSTSTAPPPKHNVNRKLNFSINSVCDLNSTPNVSQISDSQSVIIHKPTHRAFSTPYHSNNLNENAHDEARTRKRRLEDLFGDIYDIDFDDNEAKKLKSSEEIDNEMIKRILEARRLNKEKLNPLRQTTAKTLIKHNDVYRPVNISYEVPRWPFITVTHSDNERLYVRCHSAEYYREEINDINFKSSSLADDGILGLKNKQEMWRDAKILLEKQSQAKDQVAIRRPATDISLIELADDKLWVDIYRPKRYIELLSDEGTNRALLKWLKMWDKVVFNREPTKPKFINPNEVSNFNKRTGKFDNTKWKTKKKNIGPVLNTERDELGRPMQKIALLCGPPGLGKTTLAHTIARHAGYNVMEMNASDDRSPEMFRNLLENGTQMRALNVYQDGVDYGKPNCIIIDEIDGAPVQSIDFLIKFASGAVVQKGGKKSGNQKTPLVLKRPVICICNDIYVPALRALRQCAFVVTFPPTENSRLAERLLEISKDQNLKTDLGALLVLADKTNCDVRSCLSALQFFSGRQKQLRIMDVYKSNIGQKDMQKGMFAVWKDIFQIRRPTRGITAADSKRNDEVIDLEGNGQDNEMSFNASRATDMSAGTRMKYVLDTMHAVGDYERLMQGVYENYLSMRQPDPDMLGVCDATRWFCFSDHVLHLINATQNYSTYGYLPYAFAAWHLQFASLAWQKMQFPSKGFEAQQKRATALGVLEALRSGSQSTGRTAVISRKQLVLDVLSLLKRILSPSLRSVSLQLLTPSERLDLRHAVNVMADLGLAYSQGRSVDGTYHYQLEPDIDLVGLFPDIPQPQKLSYWAQQLIAREVDVEKIRRIAPKVKEGSSRDKGNDSRRALEKNVPSKEPERLPNHLQRLQPKAAGYGLPKKNLITKDFFGRIVSNDSASASGNANQFAVDDIVKSPVWFKYKEGCNQAVRRKVRMVDLL